METIIILHGWGSAKERWSQVRKELEKRRMKVVTPDLPGFREENELNRPWDLNDYVSWLEDLVNLSEDIHPPFFLMGHSFGGGVAAKYTSRNPENVKGLVLVSAAIVRMEKKGLVFLAKLSKIMKKFSFFPGYKPFRRFIYYKVLKKPDYIRAEGPLKETLKNVIKEDLTPILSGIKNRTLILWGEEDILTPVKNTEVLQASLENSELTVFEGVGHLLYKEVPPERIADEICKFIEKG